MLTAPWFWTSCLIELLLRICWWTYAFIFAHVTFWSALIKPTQYVIHRDAPPLLPSDTTQGYRTVKAKLGCKKVRPWKWMPFTNPARRDGAIFHHWRRVAEEGKDYPFARFNKVGPFLLHFFTQNDLKWHCGDFFFFRATASFFFHSQSFCFCFTLSLKTVQVPVYSEQEYQVHLHDDGWTKAETDHLFDLCKRFDLRFIVVHDRYDHQQYRVKSLNPKCMIKNGWIRLEDVFL